MVNIYSRSIDTQLKCKMFKILLTSENVKSKKTVHTLYLVIKNRSDKKKLYFAACTFNCNPAKNHILQDIQFKATGY